MKYFGLAAAALVMTMGAYASTVTINCTTTPDSLEGQTQINSTAIVCPDFSSITGATYISVTVEAEDSFSQANGSLTYVFSYTGIDPDFEFLNGSAPNTCVTAGAGVSTSCSDTLTGSNIAFSQYQLGGTATDASSYVGGGSWTIATLAGSISSGTPFPNFAAGATYTETLSYSTIAPEPGSMLLLSGGLLAIGLIGRKKLVRK